jgi:membrane protein YqaA with SNARE-associated domain
VLRPVYDWMLRQAASRQAPFVLSLLAFVEPIIFPVPPDVMLAPMVVMKPENTWRYAILTTIASVLGGSFSYFIGYMFVDWAVAVLSARSSIGLEEYRRIFEHWGVLFILAKGFVPVPFMIITYAAGAAHFSFAQFLAAATVTRGGRFCLSAWLSKRYGPQVLERVERNLMLWASLLVVAAIALVLLIRFIS